nr:hypothetical protein Iba_chr06cCG15500 [Ipomoea batatas]
MSIFEVDQTEERRQRNRGEACDGGPFVLDVSEKNGQSVLRISALSQNEEATYRCRVLNAIIAVYVEWSECEIVLEFSSSRTGMKGGLVGSTKYRECNAHRFSRRWLTSNALPGAARVCPVGRDIRNAKDAF